MLRAVVERLLRTCAILASLLVIVSFGLFARDEFAGASNSQQSKLAGRPGPTLPSGADRTQPRRFIDGAARTLLKPFSFASPSGSRWAARGLPTLLALVVYGFGLGFLARAAKGLP